jgi:hypothetical protein
MFRRIPDLVGISMDRPESSFKRRAIVPEGWLWFWRPFYALKAAWRHLRISKAMTRAFGPQYRRSRDLIEIDITYACNLHCLNCNRSVTQAPDKQHMPLSMIESFVNESIAKDKRWRRIRVLGGEPTMHPEFSAIIEELRRYKRWHSACLVEVVTNGHGKAVNAKLNALPDDIWVENSHKTSVVQPTFGPFNMAPVDDPRYDHADYANGCAIMDECGMGLTPSGYYPCAVAGGIDRITNDGLGQQTLPADSDDMLAASKKLCRLCGRFRAGHFIPRNLRPPLLEEQISPTWEKLYNEWRLRKEQDATHAVRVTVRGAVPSASAPGEKA